MGINLAPPDSSYTGKAGNCKHMFLEPSTLQKLQMDITGLNTTVAPVPTSGMSGGLLTLRAILYVPRPAGTTSNLDNDLYTARYQHFHHRDLWIIRNVLKANAVRLAPWNPANDHSDFLDRCRRHNLFVIPTFDLQYFFSTQVRQQPFPQRQDEVFQGFLKFLQGARSDSKQNEDIIIMWSVNYGLNLNETVQLGPLSDSVRPEISEEYFELLRVIRKAHWVEECRDNSSCPDGRFGHPLAIPLMTDSKRHTDDIGWYLGFAESVWGTWPTDMLELGITQKQFDQLRPQGAFDAWFVQALPPTTGSAEQDLLADLLQANATPATSGGAAMTWYNVSSQSFSNPKGYPLSNCGGHNTSHPCTYISQKLVLGQYGFASQANDALSMKVKADPGQQQQLLQQVWAQVSSGQQISCVDAGVTIDEWMDDWDRSEAMGCPGSPYTHPREGACDEQQPGRTVHYDWFGLNGQYTFLWFHCLDPRYNPNHASDTPCNGTSTGTVGNCAFSFDGRAIWPQGGLDVGLCATISESFWLLVLNFCLLLGGCVGPIWKCVCCTQRREKLTNLPGGVPHRRRRSNGFTQGNDGAASLLTSNNTLLEMDTGPIAVGMRSNELTNGYGDPALRSIDSSSEATMKARVEQASMLIRIPDLYCESPDSHPSFEFSIGVQAKALRGSKVQFTKSSIEAHLRAHVHSQEQRLQQQLAAEVLAIEDERWGRIVDNETPHFHRIALLNIYSRVMEGYLAWLDSRSDDNHELRLKAMTSDHQRQSWMYYTEALLLRVLESLSEHVLHAPELLALLYHEIRWSGEGNDSLDGNLPERPHFAIDLDILHAGLEAMRNNLNPFDGGVNFDDLNDFGEAQVDGYNNSDHYVKTYRESPSFRVILDLLTDFGPVVTVKLWVFYAAWYVHGGDTTGNSGPSGSIFVPKGSRADAAQIFTLVDVSVLFSVEILLLLHGMGQRRLCWTRAHSKSRLRKGHGRWATWRFGLLSLAFMSLVLLLGVGKVGQDLCGSRPLEVGVQADCPVYDSSDPNFFALICCVMYAVVRIIILTLSNCCRRIPFVSGAPKDSQQHNISTTYFETGSEATLDAAPAPMPSQPSGELEMVPDTSFMTILKYDGPPSKDTSRWTPALVWICVLLLCFAFETLFVVPLVAGFTFSDFCGEACSDRVTVKIGPFNAVPSECSACTAAIASVYIIMILTAFMDLHFIFYIMIGVGGYAMGEKRGLRNVLSTALRVLDMDASSRQQQVHEKDLWSAITDGRAMECVFGTSWRIVWSCAVESLVEDSQISEAAANRMVTAARTVRWKGWNRAAASELAMPGMEYRMLRFTAKALRGGNGNWRKSGLTCCISKLQVKHCAFREPIVENITQKAAKSVKVESPEAHEALMAGLDDQLVATKDMPEFGVKKGWQLFQEEGNQAPRSRFNAAEDLLNLRTSVKFPVVLLFTDPVAFNTVVVSFSRAKQVQAVSFHTNDEDSCFDPLKWEVDGSPDGVRWLRLQTQATEFETPTARLHPLNTLFAVEPWRCPKITSGPTTIDLRTLPPVVCERLCFFASSLRALLQGKVVPVKPGRDTFLDCELGRIPSLTQVVPVFEEQVILPEDLLCASDGRNTNLGFLISQAEEEWANFAKLQKMHARELFNAFVYGDLQEWLRRAESDRQMGDPEAASRIAEIQNLIMEVRLWASQRSQTVARTVNGAIQYHKALELLPSVQGKSDPRAALEGLVQLIIAGQTYGLTRSTAMDREMRQLLQRYQKYPVYLVCDFESAGDNEVRKEFRELIRCFWFKKFHQTTIPHYASVKCRFNQAYKEGDDEETMLEIIEVLPRCYPLLLKERTQVPPNLKSQGKAANQLGALRFAPGHFIQMMDANMGAFFGEACKVPFVLRRFQPPGSNRKAVQARIIGFREYIFTEQQGVVGAAMAHAEWTFGTILQRFLAGLGARMHYGHPDFFDGFWASNRGSVSKASPVINLSEDIFAGFNVLMRGEHSRHVDCLEWEKGREASFNKASLFFTKVASGNVGVMRSRDLKILTESLNITDGFSFYFASVGFYLYILVTDLSMQLYVLIFLLLTLASRSLNDVGALDSALAAEWLISFGILAMFPRLMELTLEYGVMEGITRFIPSIPSSVVMFSFMNKSIAAAVGSTIRRGFASYIPTGRVNANTHYGWRECYFLYRESHYYPALRIFLLYMTYRLLTQSFGVAALPMMVLLATASCWVAAPIVFCPQPTLQSIKDDLSEFWCFCIASPLGACDSYLQTSKKVNLEDRLLADIKNEQANLYDVWLRDRLAHKRAPLGARVLEFVVGVVVLVALLMVVMGAMVDQMKTVFLLVSVNFFLLALWRALDRPTILLMLSFVFWLTAIPMFLDFHVLGSQVGTLLVAFILTFEVLRSVERFVLLVAWAIPCLRPDPNCGAWPETKSAEREAKKEAMARVNRYDRIVEYLYINLMGYQWHLYVAIVLLLVNLAVQLFLVVLEMLGGLHSWWLLNGNLKGGPCSLRRPEYKPPGSDDDPPSEKALRLAQDMRGLQPSPSRVSLTQRGRSLADLSRAAV